MDVFEVMELSLNILTSPPKVIHIDLSVVNSCDLCSIVVLEGGGDMEIHPGGCGCCPLGHGEILKPFQVG